MSNRGDDLEWFFTRWTSLFKFIPAEVATVAAALNFSPRKGTNAKRWAYLLLMLESAQKLWLHLEENYSVCPFCQKEKPLSFWQSLLRQNFYCDCVGSALLENREIVAGSFGSSNSEQFIIALKVLEIYEGKRILVIEINWKRLEELVEFHLWQSDLVSDSETSL